MDVYRESGNSCRPDCVQVQEAESMMILEYLLIKCSRLTTVLKAVRCCEIVSVASRVDLDVDRLEMRPMRLRVVARKALIENRVVFRCERIGETC
jgi:hypothetical protein